MIYKFIRMFNTMALLFQRVSSTEVRIMVIANLMVSPSEAYILKSADVKYKVLLLKQNTITSKFHPIAGETS